MVNSISTILICASSLLHTSPFSFLSQPEGLCRRCTAGAYPLRSPEHRTNGMPPADPAKSAELKRSSLKGSSTQLNNFEARSLHPSDAFNSPPRLQSARSRTSLNRVDSRTTIASSHSDARKRRDKLRGRSSSRRRVRPWKKLLWVKQSYPDNYTDEETFLDHLQRNPSWRPYEFWPLVADSTIIVQHVCSVIIFVSCFVGIFQERISPMTVVGWATLGTVASWVLRDYWHTYEDEEDQHESRPVSRAINTPENGLLITAPSSRNTSPPRSITLDGHKDKRYAGMMSPPLNHSSSTLSEMPTSPSSVPPFANTYQAWSPQTIERLTTAKSAILIYFSLLGLSPILKSLTKSTSSDSIWALSSWLMGINVFTFDYGAGPEAKFPASLSTNAALMASTVLASRLPSTTHVFSLTLFSIEVFGLFPMFRRHLRHYSWTLHLWLTICLVIAASGGLSMVISGGGFGYALLGIIMGGLCTCLGLGVTSWWLIALQRYKNEIHGPWDPARPVIRRHWE